MQAEISTRLSLAVLDVLLCGLVDQPRNMRIFEDVGGLAAIVRVLKDKSVSQTVRYVSLTLPRITDNRDSRTESLALAGSRSSRSCSFTSCQKRTRVQLLLPKLARPTPRPVHLSPRLGAPSQKFSHTQSNCPACFPARPISSRKRRSSRSLVARHLAVHWEPIPPRPLRERCRPRERPGLWNEPLAVRANGCSNPLPDVLRLTVQFLSALVPLSLRKVARQSPIGTRRSEEDRPHAPGRYPPRPDL